MPTYNRRDELVAAMALALIVQAESTVNAPAELIPNAIWALLSKTRRLQTLAAKGEDGAAWASAQSDAEMIAREIGVTLNIAHDGAQVRAYVLTPRTGRYNTTAGSAAGWEL